MTTATLISEEVERGAAKLDEEFGEGKWEHRIDLDTLDMMHNCVIEQLYGHGEFGRLMDKWEGRGDGDTLGFNASADPDEWRTLIRERLADAA